MALSSFVQGATSALGRSPLVVPAVTSQAAAAPRVQAVAPTSALGPGVLSSDVQAGVMGPGVPAVRGQSTQGPQVPNVIATGGGPATPPMAPTVPSAPAPFPDKPFVATKLPDDSAHWNDPGQVAVAASAPSTPVADQTTTAPSAAAASTTLVATAPTSAAAAPATAATTTAIVKPSLWVRILTFLGFLKPAAAAATPAVHGEPMTIEQAAVSLVRRANNGDQNAMGLLVMIRENAMRGDRTAQKTYQAMRRYIDSRATHAGEPSRLQPYNMGHEPSRLQPYNMGHEPSRLQPYNMGHEPINRGWAKAVYLANGPTLGDEKVADVASHFGAESDAFVSGVLLPTYPAVSSAHNHGKIVGMARKIQAVRMPGSRISDYSATVGWELGE